MVTQDPHVLAANVEAGTYWLTYNYPTTPPSVALPLGMAALMGRPVTDIEPLYETVVNPDALDAMFRDANTEPEQRCELSFTYAGCTVHVRDFGRIVVEASDDLQQQIRTRAGGETNIGPN